MNPAAEDLGPYPKEINNPKIIGNFQKSLPTGMIAKRLPDRVVADEHKFNSLK